MTEAEALDRLAEACGILPDYHDIWGGRQVVAPETKRALLAAMGVAAGSPEDVARELRRRQEAPWRRALPPVQVVREPARTIRIPVRLPGSRLASRLVAVLEREADRRVEIPFRPGDLETTATAEIGGEPFVETSLPLARHPGPGYHRLALRDDAGAEMASMRLIAAPARCHVPPSMARGGRLWGPAAQLYALRSESDWGVGDFGALARLARIGGESGAGLIGLNPLHALFPSSPEHASPYSPSSRSLLNGLYLDVPAVRGFDTCAEARERVAAPAFQERLARLRRGGVVDWSNVAAVKREVLEILWRHFRRAHLEAGTGLADEFREFLARGGRRLAAYGAFEALEERLRPAGAWGWPAWPEACRRPDGPGVADMAAESPDRIGFFQWLQWECDYQLAAAARICRDQGLEIGLYLDLAVSADRAGFETWWWQDVFALEAGLGAPPDDFNLAGQSWGLPPWIPERLRESGYQPFVEVLRETMRHAGALRLDHVMGMMRSFWVPPGKTAREGAYVSYPFRDMLGVLALESERHGCLIVGEDLGTVPDEVRQALPREEILSYRLLPFEREPDGSFRAPDRMEPRALVAVSTHDLPTLAGWWRGRDIALRASLGHLEREGQEEELLAERSRDRTRILFALRREGLLPDPGPADLASVPDEMTPELMVAIHRYLARSPSRVLTFQLEDVLGQLEQVNLPGTVDEHPNWRRRLSAGLESLPDDHRYRELTTALRRERGAGAPALAEGADGAARKPRSALIPRATYRLQLTRDFPFAAAAELVPYLAGLGISHLYASPFLQARPGSPHGYDIIDHRQVSRELGGRQGLRRLVERLQDHGMGLVLDMVPNHMGVGSDNAWWMSVLEHGPASPHTAFFDIDWRPQKRELHGRILLPLLEDHYGRVLEAGMLRPVLDTDRGNLSIAYHEHRFPVDPGTYPVVLGFGLDVTEVRMGRDHPILQELKTLLDALRGLPGREEADPERRAARLRDAAVHCRHLARLAAGSPPIREHLGQAVSAFTVKDEDPGAISRLDRLLDAQAFRLAFWRTAADEINYRRFFDINELAGLRQEEPETFRATHRLVLDLVRRGWVEGLRLDHPDGLHDPAGYIRRLAEATGGVDDAGRPRIWTVAEKILAPGESLSPDWAIHGTTGYDFGSEAGGLFVDGAGERAHDRITNRFVGRRSDFDELVHDSKRLILDTALASELTRLTDDLDRISEADRRTRDFTRERLRRALAEVIACFPIYRTYVTAEVVSDQDREAIEQAVAQARRRDRAADTSVYGFIRDVLTLDAAPGRNDEVRRRLAGFAQRFQQATGPVMAKGVEDTAFYRYNRLLALNEVGDHPPRFGRSPGAFHEAATERARSWPHAMLATSTHDSKRSEDARLRIAALSELPEMWETTLRRLAGLARPHRRRLDGKPAPDRHDEYALYQTLIGIWPERPVDVTALAVLRDRVKGWALKAIREAKIHGSWIEPDEAYEEAVLAFTSGVLADPGSPFVAALEPLARRTAAVAEIHGLAQTLLKLTAPGVPDIYQGQEIAVSNLVDPDNRRPVDFDRRRQLLADLQHAAGKDALSAAGAVDAVLDHPDPAAVRLWVTWRTLELRRRRPDLFSQGSYRPLKVGGEHCERVVAFARCRDGERVAVIAPRLVAPLTDPGAGRRPLGESWGDTWVEIDGRWQDRLTGRVREGARLSLARALDRLPVALLLAASGPGGTS